MILIKNDKLYDRLKFIAQIFLPALGSLYFGLAGIWGLPKAEEIVGTIVLVDTFLGVILQLSTNAYIKSDERFDGAINVLDRPEGGKTFELDISESPMVIEEKDEILFKVNKS